MILNNHSQQGLAALIIIIMIGAAALFMAYSASLLSLGELETSYTYQQGAEAMALADGCVEEAMYRLKITDTYQGGNLVFDNGSCIITTDGYPDKLIYVTATVGNYYHYAQAYIYMEDDQITITNWKDSPL